jgi:hypothetical protein
MLSHKIGIGIQTFRIKNFWGLFSLVEDLGPDYEKYLESRKIVKLNDEDEYYALVQIPYKDIEEFVIRIDKTILSIIDWNNIAEISSKCRWRGPKIDKRFIN